MHRSCVFLTSLLVLSFLDDKISASDADVLRSAIQGWEKLRDVYERSHLVFETQRDDVIHNPRERNFSHSRKELFRLDSTHALSFDHLDNEDGTEMQNVRGRNKSYEFAIDRAKDTLSWEVGEISPTASGIRESFMELGDVPWSVNALSLLDIVKDPSFKLIKVSNKRNGDEECKLISFELDHTQTTGLLSLLKTCNVLLSPERDYAVVGFEASYGTPATYNHFQGLGKCTYEGTYEGVPAMKSYVYTLVRANGKKITWTTSVASLEKCTKQKSDFTLSAFGLSEPKSKYAFTTTTWLFVIGSVLLTIGLVGKRFAKSRD